MGSGVSYVERERSTGSIQSQSRQRIRRDLAARVTASQLTDHKPSVQTVRSKWSRCLGASLRTKDCSCPQLWQKKRWREAGISA